MEQTRGTVIENRPVKSDYHILVCSAPGVAQAAKPGQFIHLRVPGLHEARLRRPFSIYEADAAAGTVTFLYKVVGHGTGTLSGLLPGASVDLLGPLGNGFPLNPEGTPFLIGGGFGVAPLYFLAKSLPRKGILFVGGRTAGDILETDRFRELGWEVRIATQDGSLCEKALVTAPLDAALAQCPKAELYACGPDGMLKAVGDRAIAAGCRAWLSLDKHMVCAVGACLACVQALRRADGSEWVGRVCKDGPVFEAREIIWGQS